MIIRGSVFRNPPKINGKYVGNIDESTQKQIDAIYALGEVKVLKNALEGYTLDPFQTMIPPIAYLSKNFLIGVDTGLGKSLMIALYLLIHKEKGTLNKKNRAIVVTTTSSLGQIKSVIENSTGLRVKHLPGDEKKLLKAIQDGDIFHHDVYIVTNSVFAQSTEFNRLYAYFAQETNIFILDESMCVANTNSITHQTVKGWLTTCEYKLFLNATVIERSLEQPYNQLSLLDDTLLPSLSYLQRIHEVYEKGPRKRGRRTTKTFKGYKDLDVLLNSIPYHYVNISRSDLGYTFDYEDIVVPLIKTPLQEKIEDSYNYTWALFSPSTKQDTKVIPFTRSSVPALDATVRIATNEYNRVGGGIVIYAEPTACKDVIKNAIELEIPDVKIGIIDGSTGDNKEPIRLKFLANEINILIINIPEALDLVNGQVMIMHTIPSKHYQARARIQRGFGDSEIKRRYYYLVYLNSSQSNFVKTKWVIDEETLDNSQNRGINTARTVAKKVIQYEGNVPQALMDMNKILMGL